MEKFWTHEIPTRKNVGPTKYPREKMLDPLNTHEKTFRTHEGTIAPWQETHKTYGGTRPMEFSTLVSVKDRSSRKRCSVRKDVLRNFTKFTGKHLCQSLFFKVCNFIKKEALAHVFPCS